MTQDIFIGVDGGGSKTKFLIENANGELLSQGKSGPAQILLSTDQAWESIYDGLAKALRDINLSLKDDNYNFHIGLALAGTESAQARSKFLSHYHPFKTLYLQSDALAACLGAHHGENGAIVIIGTGIKGFQIEGDYQTTASGWGFPQDDKGSGAWIGLRAVQTTFESIDKRRETSELTQSVLKLFGNSIDNFFSWSIHANPTDYAKLAPLVIKHSDQDQNAKDIMQQAGHAVDLIIHALKKQTINKNRVLPCCLFGGIATHILPWLSQASQAHIIERKFSATKGAILMLRNHMKNKIKGKI